LRQTPGEQTQHDRIKRYSRHKSDSHEHSP
jgi:hypothetical protein